MDAGVTSMKSESAVKYLIVTRSWSDPRSNSLGERRITVNKV